MSPARSAALRAFARATVRLLLLFAVVFYGVDALTQQRSSHWRLYADWELAIPYWPAMFLLYFSVVVLPCSVGWRVSDAAAVRTWERRMAAAVVGAGLMFLLLPAQLGYAPVDAGAWQAWARFAHLVAGRHNLLPSLHVALSAVTLATLWPGAGRGLRAGLTLWFVLLVASVLLTHQHHVADVLAGWLLAAVVLRIVTGEPPRHAAR